LQISSKYPARELPVKILHRRAGDVEFLSLAKPGRQALSLGVLCYTYSGFR
jgi:hypothetical protein